VRITLCGGWFGTISTTGCAWDVPQQDSGDCYDYGKDTCPGHS
jgi:hypothetical protein